MVDAFFARTQTSVGIGQTIDFSVINRNVSLNKILLMWFIIFPFNCLQTEHLVKAFKCSK